MPGNKFKKSAFKKFKRFFSRKRKKDTPDDKLEKRHQKTFQRLIEFKNLETYLGVNNNNNIELPDVDVNNDNNIEPHVVDKNDVEATIVNGIESTRNDDATENNSVVTYVNEDEYYNAEKMYRAMKRIERSLMKELTLAAALPECSQQLKDKFIRKANEHKKSYEQYKDNQLKTYSENRYGSIKFIKKQDLREPYIVNTYLKNLFLDDSTNSSNIIDQSAVAQDSSPAQQPARGQHQ